MPIWAPSLYAIVPVPTVYTVSCTGRGPGGTSWGQMATGAAHKVPEGKRETPVHESPDKTRSFRYEIWRLFFHRQRLEPFLRSPQEVRRRPYCGKAYRGRCPVRGSPNQVTDRKAMGGFLLHGFPPIRVSGCGTHPPCICGVGGTGNRWYIVGMFNSERSLP